MTIKDDAGVTQLSGAVLTAMRQLAERGQDNHSPECSEGDEYDCTCGYDGREASRQFLRDLVGRRNDESI